MMVDVGFQQGSYCHGRGSTFDEDLALSRHCFTRQIEYPHYFSPNVSFASSSPNRSVHMTVSPVAEYINRFITVPDCMDPTCIFFNGEKHVHETSKCIIDEQNSAFKCDDIEDHNLRRCVSYCITKECEEMNSCNCHCSDNGLTPTAMKNGPCVHHEAYSCPIDHCDGLGNFETTNVCKSEHNTLKKSTNRESRAKNKSDFFNRMSQPKYRQEKMINRKQTQSGSMNRNKGKSRSLNRNSNESDFFNRMSQPKYRKEKVTNRKPTQSVNRNKGKSRSLNRNPEVESSKEEKPQSNANECSFSWQSNNLIREAILQRIGDGPCSLEKENMKSTTKVKWKQSCSERKDQPLLLRSEQFLLKLDTYQIPNDKEQRSARTKRNKTNLTLCKSNNDVNLKKTTSSSSTKEVILKDDNSPDNGKSSSSKESFQTHAVNNTYQSKKKSDTKVTKTEDPPSSEKVRQHEGPKREATQNCITSQKSYTKQSSQKARIYPSKIGNLQLTVQKRNAVSDEAKPISTISQDWSAIDIKDTVGALKTIIDEKTHKDSPSFIMPAQVETHPDNQSASEKTFACSQSVDFSGSRLTTITSNDFEFNEDNVLDDKDLKGDDPNGTFTTGKNKTKACQPQTFEKQESESDNNIQTKFESDHVDYSLKRPRRHRDCGIPSFHMDPCPKALTKKHNKQHRPEPNLDHTDNIDKQKCQTTRLCDSTANESAIRRNFKDPDGQRCNKLEGSNIMYQRKSAHDGSKSTVDPNAAMSYHALHDTRNRNRATPRHYSNLPRQTATRNEQIAQSYSIVRKQCTHPSTAIKTHEPRSPKEDENAFTNFDRKLSSTESVQSIDLNAFHKDSTIQEANALRPYVNGKNKSIAFQNSLPVNDKRYKILESGKDGLTDNKGRSFEQRNAKSSKSPKNHDVQKSEKLLRTTPKQSKTQTTTDISTKRLPAHTTRENVANRTTSSQNTNIGSNKIWRKQCWTEMTNACVYDQDSDFGASFDVSIAEELETLNTTTCPELTVDTDTSLSDRLQQLHLLDLESSEDKEKCPNSILSYSYSEQDHGVSELCLRHSSSPPSQIYTEQTKPEAHIEACNCRICANLQRHDTSESGHKCQRFIEQNRYPDSETCNDYSTTYNRQTPTQGTLQNTEDNESEASMADSEHSNVSGSTQDATSAFLMYPHQMPIPPPCRFPHKRKRRRRKGQAQEKKSYRLSTGESSLKRSSENKTKNKPESTIEQSGANLASVGKAGNTKTSKTKDTKVFRKLNYEYTNKLNEDISPNCTISPPTEKSDDIMFKTYEKHSPKPVTYGRCTRA